MRPQQAQKLIRQAEVYPSLRRTDEFIEAKLSMPDLYRLCLEMGPNCNRNCFHCCVECSPKKKGLPKLEFVRMAIRGAADAQIRRIILTHGEPLREENKSIVQYLAPLSNYVPLSIITNGMFAKTLNEAVEWFTVLKTGFPNYPGISKETKAKLIVSFGRMYDLPAENYLNINTALKQVFPDLDYPRFLFYSFIGLGEVKDSKQRVGEVIDSIHQVFGKGKDKVVIKNHLSYLQVNTSFARPFIIDVGFCEPQGRARNLPWFDAHLPIRELNPQELLADSQNTNNIELRHNGDLNFVDAGRITGRELIYGNIAKSTLKVIQNRIRKDVFYQAFKLGDTPLLYFTAQQIHPHFKVTGRTGYDAAQAIFSNPDIVNDLRGYYETQGIVPVYKHYLSTLDLRKNQFV